MATSKMVKVGAAAGAAYLGWKYLDENHAVGADIELARRLTTMRTEIAGHHKNGYNCTKMWYTTLKKNPKKTMLLYLDEKVTYKQVEERSNQVANWLLSKGLKRGDTVALLMENRPEFIISWLGMTKIGVKVALINTALVKKPLLHCVKISSCSMLFFGTELASSVGEVMPEIEELGIMVFGNGRDACDFCPVADEELAAAAVTRVSSKLTEGIGMSDVFGYIYTSGTTGLPKAAVILHQKMFAFGALMANGFQVKESDVVYTCLPLFHSAGGGLGVNVTIYTGCTMVIKKKFSASEFWKDCVKYKVTVAQYIGELCRYLILNAPTPEERQHRVRIVIGNGMRPEIWGEFQSRFNIPEVGEFYGATEGNGALINHCTTPDAQGACGRLGTLLRKVMGVKLVKFDVVEEEIVRDPKTGFAIECGPNEPGELLFPIKPDDPSTAFAGYEDPAATAKKIAKDIAVKGDQFFRTGDLLSRDEKSFFHFVDRIGDTFRWHGENCSTTEVTEVMAPFPGVQEINVYGVQIPNNLDGRCPMAAITPTGGDINALDFDGLAKHAQANLPKYAVPIFLRIQPEIAVTATMKHQKVALKKEGMDIAQVTDPLYWLNPDSKTYEPFTPEAYQRVINQQARL
ncbi:Long-chain fatty acid transport protein 4 (FATP-4) (Fatty acid transport protein 4) (Arachidonate--CoA ligase) (Long-chain-fatty-acid--CoA ligase) (Solute carrier family 27 member 4) (Very long-chain acyl-CoA synthetase 4) (ACSVL4) [Durusdinium trenchii]|uniref:Uncharacterized protein n=1 Tax=Durusdinium trenchii TaxID=1381693 RepID=A0ABP0IC54_9DINO